MVAEHHSMTKHTNMLIHAYAHEIQSGNQPECDKFVSQVLTRSHGCDNPCVIIDMCWEGFNFYRWFDQLGNVINTLRSEKPHAKFLMTINSHFKQHADKLLSYPLDDILFVDYFLYTTCTEVFRFHTSNIKSNWDSDSSKFVCVGGRLKKDRAYFFENMHAQGVLTDCLYSLSNPHNDNNFYVSDKIKHIVNNSNLNEIGHKGWLVYNNIFENCLFHVVVETSCLTVNDYPWITEKTWTAIINHNPFIIFGDNGCSTELEKMGFKTFDHYLPVPNYQELDLDAKCQALGTNIKWWTSHIKTQKYKIEQDVKHNFKILKMLFACNYLNIKQFIRKHNLACSVHHVVPTDYEALNDRYRHFYQNVKEPDWPHSQFFREIYTLPVEVIRDLLQHDHHSFLNPWTNKKQEFENFCNSIKHQG